MTEGGFPSLVQVLEISREALGRDLKKYVRDRERPPSLGSQTSIPVERAGARRVRDMVFDKCLGKEETP